jgi:hypothetical protein
MSLLHGFYGFYTAELSFKTAQFYGPGSREADPYRAAPLAGRQVPFNGFEKARVQMPSNGRANKRGDA